MHNQNQTGLIIGILSILATCCSYAANFNIIPSTSYPIPTQIYPSETLSAYYTVTNQTSTSRFGYRVQGAPATVVQNSSVGFCSNPVNLTAHGSCLLRLDINGEAISNFALCKGASCTTSAVPLHVKGLSFSALIAAGTYTGNNSLNYPLLANSINGGQTWSYSIYSNSPSLPTDFGNTGYFNGASCSGNNCIAAGAYISSMSLSYPLLAASANEGQVWDYKISSSKTTLPTDFNGNGYFSSASCSNNRCIAAGHYDNFSATTCPLVATSQNGGQQWAYTISCVNQTLPFNFTDANLFSAYCDTTTCLTSGNYSQDNNSFYPLLATSQNGSTWTYTITRTNPTLPQGYGNFGYLNGVSCSGNNCITAGAYFSMNPNSQSYPLLAASTNFGQSWAYKISENNTTLPADFRGNGFFSSASCSGLFCIAAGHYNNVSNVTCPLVASSQDGGQNWAYTVSCTTPALPANFSGATDLNSATCIDKTCIAVGTYKATNNVFYPLSVTSTNGGLTWSYTISSNTPTLPADFSNNGKFNSISCLDGICTAAGSYSTTNGTTDPLLALSLDEGKTWAYKITSTLTPLPNDFGNYGVFNGTSIGNVFYNNLSNAS